jgi:hypothetical protein
MTYSTIPEGRRYARASVKPNVGNEIQKVFLSVSTLGTLVYCIEVESKKVDRKYELLHVIGDSAYVEIFFEILLREGLLYLNIPK